MTEPGQEQKVIDDLARAHNQDLVERILDGDALLYTRNDLVRFFNYLTADTDTFDKVMVQIEREHGKDHTLPNDLVQDLVKEFIKTIGGV